jgi:Flp pilus assembly protein TadG
MSNLRASRSLLLRLRRDKSGSILIQASITLVAVMGLIGLALDGARLFMVHNDLQALADAAALAGAAKLEGTLGARAAADSSARAVNNDVHWYDVSAPKILPGTSGIQFYKTLDDLDADNPATTDKDAIYIKVSTGSWQVAPTFVSAVRVMIGGVVNNDAAHATAVATSGTEMCVPASMMLCNPDEPLSGSTGDTSSFNPTPGSMYVFSTTGNTGGFSPGVFNLLDDASGDGSDPAIKKLLSQQYINGCNTGTVGPAQGQKTDATSDGINVRFDQQMQNVSGANSGIDLTPAPIKIGGLKLKNGSNFCNFNQLVSDTPTDPATYDSQCAANPPTISCALPRDRGLPAPNAGGIARCSPPDCGPNQADLQAYWANHHSTPFATAFPNGVSTRYDVYVKEVSDALAGAPSDWTTDAIEPHAPQCAPASTEIPPEYAASRRVAHVAIIDCAYWGIQGNSVNNIRLNRYADFFLTEPVPSGGITGGNIYAEFVGNHAIDQAGSALHSNVWLVR